MKIAVTGLWHLGLVTAACLTNAGYEVIAFDPDKKLIADLNKAKTPIMEPGLDELLSAGVANNKLTYTANIEQLKNNNIVWVTYDTPVNDKDEADVQYVTNQVKRFFPFLSNNTLVILSSQLPVGTARSLQKAYQENYSNPVTFVSIPENLRLGNAIRIFTLPDRIIVGLQEQNDKATLEKLLSPFSNNIIWMSLESAEMTKHALNAFLATSVTFINELAILCEKVGANANEVEKGLKSEERIGPKAYVRPGGAIGGGTLLRDIHYLNQLGERVNEPTHLFSSVLKSNHYHKNWINRKLKSIFNEMGNKTLGVLGLTYKTSTDTLRRSTSVDLCQALAQEGVTIFAFDPVIKNIPDDIASFIHLKKSITETINKVDGVLVLTEWPQFRELTAEAFLKEVNQPLLIDPTAYLVQTLGNDSRIQYHSVGRTS
jgi:UDPglucose 6-dehydrogenase